MTTFVLLRSLTIMSTPDHGCRRTDRAGSTSGRPGPRGDQSLERRLLPHPLLGRQDLPQQSHALLFVQRAVANPIRRTQRRDRMRCRIMGKRSTTTAGRPNRGASKFRVRTITKSAAKQSGCRTPIACRAVPNARELAKLRVDAATAQGKRLAPGAAGSDSFSGWNHNRGPTSRADLLCKW